MFDVKPEDRYDAYSQNILDALIEGPPRIFCDAAATDLDEVRISRGGDFS